MTQRGYFSEYLTQKWKDSRRKAPHWKTKLIWEALTDRQAPTVVNLPKPKTEHIISLESKWIILEENYEITFPAKAFEPKVFIDYETDPRCIPRNLEIERRKRKYQSVQIEELLQEYKIEKYQLVPPGVLSSILNSDEIFGLNHIANYLPLELFDDEGFDCRTPEEWMDIGMVEGMKHPVPAKCFLPSLSNTKITERDKILNYRWITSAVIDYDTDIEKYTVLSLHDNKTFVLPRIYILFLAESPEIFAFRIYDAVQRRNDCEKRIRYQLFLDLMNIEDCNQIDNSSIKKIVEMSTRNGAIGMHEETLIPYLEEVKNSYQRSTCDFLFREAVRKNPDLFKFIVIPEEVDYKIGYSLTEIDIPTYDFKGIHEYLCFIFLYCKEESYEAMTQIVNECRIASEKCLFIKTSGSVYLDNFYSTQLFTTTSVMKYLKNDWVGKVVHHIRMSLRDIKEGWFNLLVKDWYTYEISKLSRFMNLVKFHMQESLRYIVNSSIRMLVSTFECLCYPTLACDDNFVWGPDLTILTYKSSYQPIFSIDLKISDGIGPHYSTDPDEFKVQLLQLFENAVIVSHSVPQVQPFLLTNLILPDVLFLSSVGLAEENMTEEKQKILGAIQSAIIPLKAYAREYEEFVQLYFAAVEDYMKIFTADNPSATSIKEEAIMQRDYAKDLEERIPDKLEIGPFLVLIKDVKKTLLEKRWSFYKALLDYLAIKLNDRVEEICTEYTKIIFKLKEKPITIEKLFEIKEWMETIPLRVKSQEDALKIVLHEYEVLDFFYYNISDDDFKLKWQAIGFPHKITLQISDTHAMHKNETERLEKLQLGDEIAFMDNFEQLTQRVHALSSPKVDLSKCEEVAIEVRRTWKQLQDCYETGKLLNHRQKLFGIPIRSYEAISDLKKEFEPYRNLWITASDWMKWHEIWMDNPLVHVDSANIEPTVMDLQRTITKCIKIFSEIPAVQAVAIELKNQIEDFRPLIPMIEALCNPGMRDRHWETLYKETGVKIALGPTVNFNKCLELGIDKFYPHLQSLSETASKEYSIESSLLNLEKDWENASLNIVPYKDTGTYIVKISDEISQLLDDDTIIIQSLSFSQYKDAFEETIDEWERNLKLSQEVIEVWLDCQSKWLYLEPIFSSLDIARQLPNESKKFILMDRSWRRIMKNAFENPNLMKTCSDRRLLEILKDCIHLLDIVQKGLTDYLETKRMSFPRFYFLSDDELLDILSQAQHPATVQPHLRKCFENINKLKFGENFVITHMISAEGEEVEFSSKIYPEGYVECWLLSVETEMRNTIKSVFKCALLDIKKKKRNDWVLSWPGQIVIAGSQTFWTARVEAGLIEGNLSKYYKTMLKQLDGLRNLIKGQLKEVERQVLSALITIEVHSRDVVSNLLEKNVKDSTDFNWFSQLKYFWIEDELKLGSLNARFDYGYEYLGNNGRLVITPLTDRCYLTLTSALHLKFGGAPAGPAGTGKTETTKDLAKAFANQCVVFNCSDQLDVMAMGKFFKGLASSGAWACFDEFNRIDIEVLSVVAQQITSIQKAQHARQNRFMFEGFDVELKESCAVFITMNPGYAGRTELPDNLKALFRPVAMMVPNYALIAEISLFSFGFSDAKELSAKITSTFKLSSEQLSSQYHYDFGMRAVKAVIAAVGNLKRGKPDMDEKQIVLMALKNVNIPKFVSDDLKLFNGILSDLFPKFVEQPSDYGSLPETIRQVILDKGLLDVEDYVKKVLQLFDTTEVRHGLMLVGPAGSGKTRCYEVLRDSITKLKGTPSPSGQNFQAVHTYVLNPKSITMGLLYGEFDLQTHEWTDGILSSLVRHGASAAAGGGEVLTSDGTPAKDLDGNIITAEPNPDHRWYVFDGPVDAVWIENLNTVLDDNKKLCLSSGEIIKLASTQTMMFEVADLAVASPATVSRCGMVYLEPGVLGLSPFVTCWINRLPKLAEPFREDFLRLFEVYLYPAVNMIGTKEDNEEGIVIAEIISTVPSALVTSHLRLLDTRLKPLTGEGDQAVPKKPFLDLLDKLITPWFVFSLIWSVGATCDYDGRVLFSEWLRQRMAESKEELQFPNDGLVYDYRLHDGGFSDKTTDGQPCNPKWINWMEGVPPYKITPDMSYSDIEVPTIDMVRSSYLLGTLIQGEHPTLCVGPTGTGKTVVVKATVTTGLPKNFLADVVIFSARTSAYQTQDLIDSKLDRRRKGVYGPALGKKQVFFIDDFNMPALEVYGAQPPIELIRQWMDFKGWYDRKLIGEFRSIVDVSFVCAMGPPGGGRNPITPRLLRHFHFLTFNEMSDESKCVIFGTILRSWMSRLPITTEEEKLSEDYNLLRPTLNATISVYSTILQELLPTPARTHYTFNLRDLSKVFQGILMADTAEIKEIHTVHKLWYHECHRVFGDRLISDRDRHWFNSLLQSRLKQDFGVSDLKAILGEGEESLLFGTFMPGGRGDDVYYKEVKSLDEAKEILMRSLEEYNSASRTPMKLVLFQDALCHVARIARILKQPQGNALLLGMGGSGRQSLTKLAAHICDYKYFQIELTKNYGINEWREDVKRTMLDAGVRGTQTVFLFTDNQIKYENFMEDINNILNAGDVPNIYSVEDMEIINKAMKIQVQELGLAPTPANSLSVFIRHVRRNLHMVIAMRPIGEVFRCRLRQFPALVSCCTIDWFSAWPDRALQSVAYEFFKNIPDLNIDKALLNGLVYSCQLIHQSVITASDHYLRSLSRHNYVTPTSYLELIGSYANLLAGKKEELEKSKEKYTNGLKKLQSTAEEVDVLRIELERMKPELDAATAEVNQMLAQISIDTELAEETRKEVEAEEEAARIVKAETEAMAADAQRDLDEALPLLEAAEASVKSLNKNDISEVRTLKRPPPGVVLVIEAICIIKEVKPLRVATDKPGVKVNDYWEPGRGLLQDSGRFLRSLMTYDKNNIPEHVINNLRPYIENPLFMPEKIIAVSKACTSLCQWIHAIYKYYFVWLVVKPKKEALAEALETLQEKEALLEAAKARMKEVADRLRQLREQLFDCQSRRDELQKKNQLCAERLERANHLIYCLADERTRWAERINQIEQGMINVVGDSLIAGASVAYLTPFTNEYREDLLSKWTSFLSTCNLKKDPHDGTKKIEDSEIRAVPYSADCDPISLLGDPILIRKWHLEGLPRDSVSTQSAVLSANSNRWPLFIDPQGQANRWIRNMEGKRSIVILKLADQNLLHALESSVRLGSTVLLENVGEELDPGLEPLLFKQTFISAGRLSMKLGDSVIPYDSSFKLFITTKLPNPHYTPEISSKLLLVNFALSPSGLRDQLLTLSVVEERPDLEETRSALIVSNAKMKLELKELEDRILHLLNQSQGSPIDDLDLIDTLDASKKKSIEIKSKLEIAIKNEADNEEIRLKYAPLAVRSQILFFCVLELASIDPMYQYSLEWYIKIFISSIRQTEKSDDTHIRVENINRFFTLNLYVNVSRSLFERHKLLFAFLLSIRIRMEAGMINPKEWHVFLTGPTSDQGLPNPAKEWLPSRAWSEIQNFETLPKFTGFVNEFSKFIKEFHHIFESTEPHKEPLPGKWDQELDDFQHMIVLIGLRPDKIPNAMQEYVIHHLGKEFVEPLSTDLSSLYNDSTPNAAIIFVLSAGTDPAKELYKFADKMKVSRDMYVISLGQGQGAKAEKMFQIAMENGSWVFFQNCHLAPSWMHVLERLIEKIPFEVHKNFRIWLTSMPSAAFPVSILQNGTKITMEPPHGIKANMLRAYRSQVAEVKNLWDKTDEKTPTLKWLLFSLCLFHGIVLERRKFGPLGFNIPYEFTDGDLTICISQLQMFIQEYSYVPFEVLMMTAGQINYGGRVTDDWDRRCIMTIIEDFYNEDVLSRNHVFVPDGTYHQLSPSASLDDYLSYVQSLPINDDPSLFDLHSNADITHAQNETYAHMKTLVSLQPKTVSTSESLSQEEVTKEVASKILEQIPMSLPIQNITKKYPILYEECFNSVLLQEALRFNTLLKEVNSSLNLLIKALVGVVVMSDTLENMSQSLFRNLIPDLWASKAYPSLKPLGSWVKDLRERIDFMQTWINGGIPSSFWISGFFFPQAFLTGTLQNYARKHIIPIDCLSFSFKILRESPKERPEDGCCIYGMFLEGARWCKDSNLLKESRTKELYTEMPVIWLIPTEDRKPPMDGIYECPVYKTLARAGTLSTTGHSTNYVLTIELPTDENEKHWIKRGVASICALDH